ncbi:ANTH domain-containing protein [Gymnopilus junonius]|uniref:ANTH domain-containing protein n=1 Tax=Gymnopilus junonius TaxID=109634 RepID=A0A9P5NZK7_GYMJU|nr:ANTH domain-containing protein [Gymnopilus junonius]
MPALTSQPSANMSSFDKVVKLAYPIIAATWSDDGAVHDVCKALAPRIREPNAIVAFKALIVLHTMIRNGATDNVLSYLSSSEVLRLRNISANNWDGYAAPQNLQNYALYLDARIRAYKDIKHDAIKVQAENNRDMRNSQSIEEDGYRIRKDRSTKATASAPTRSKTIMGRKLRSMTVEKGLLRETRIVHSMIDALVECRFYLDDLEDELTITALRMLVKDLLILFQAGNEGIINVLEHYFEMSHVDAGEALKIYRHFCKQTEYVVEYLGVAKKLQNLLNVPIPNLKHAPVSLASALQEYLEDPNFEQNRIEYKTSKDAAERGTKTNKNGKKAGSSAEGSTSAPKVSFASSSKDQAPKTTTPGNKDVIDFFSAIEEEQPTIFNPQTNSPNVAYFQQQAASNPFAQMASGQPFLQQQPAIAVQPTGFLMPQQTAVPNPFGQFLSPQAPQPTGHRPFSAYLQVQPTGMVQQPQQTGFLQSQATGMNPFRQSMLFPHTTGMALFGGANPQAQLNGSQLQNPAVNQNFGLGVTQVSPGTSSTGIQPFTPNASAISPNTPQSAAFASASFVAPKPSFAGPSAFNNTPTRPASTPLTSTASALSPTPQPVKTHQTGTKNPFGPIVTAPPPVPKPPTLSELSAMGFSSNASQQNQINQSQANQQLQSTQQQQPQQTGFNSFSFNASALNPGGTDISSVASSFAFSNSAKPNLSTKTGTEPLLSGPLASQNTSTTATGSTFSDSFFSSSLSSQPTGTTATSSAPSIQVPSLSPVKSHLTGFTGLKPFKPSSSFGASLLESLPPIPDSGSTTPAVTGLPSTSPTNSAAGLTSLISSPPSLGGTSTNLPTSNLSILSSRPTGATGGFGGLSAGAPSSNLSFLNSQPTGQAGGFGGSSFGSKLGVGLRPQITGGGSANPFRASMAAGALPSFGASAFTPPAGNATGAAQPFATGMLGSQSQQQSQQQNTNFLT